MDDLTRQMDFSGGKAEEKGESSKPVCLHIKPRLSSRPAKASPKATNQRLLFVLCDTELFL